MGKKKASRPQIESDAPDPEVAVRAGRPEDWGHAEGLGNSDDSDTPRDERTTPIEFEQAVEEIEQIVLGLEGGDWSLAESLRQYERAVGRLQTCHSLLQDAERHVALLAGFDAEGNPVTESLGDEPAASLEHKQRSRSRHRGVGAGQDSRSEGSSSGEGGASRRKGAARGLAEEPPELF